MKKNKTQGTQRTQKYYTITPLHRALLAYDPELFRCRFDNMLVVGNDNDSALKFGNAINERVNRLHIKMIRRFVQKKNVGLQPSQLYKYVVKR